MRSRTKTLSITAAIIGLLAILDFTYSRPTDDMITEGSKVRAVSVLTDTTPMELRFISTEKRFKNKTNRSSQNRSHDLRDQKIVQPS